MGSEKRTRRQAIGGGSNNDDLSVCLISAHPLFLQQYREFLREGFQVGTQGFDPAQRLETQARAMPLVELFVIDASPLLQQAEAMISSLVARSPDSHLLILADEFSEAEAFTLLRLGAKGLMTYREAPAYLARAAREVARGGFWVPRTLLSKFVDSVLQHGGRRRIVKGMTDLSRRELEVIDCLLENLSNKEIASRLNISERTAKFHVSNLLGKYGVQRRADLIVLCYQTRPTGEPAQPATPARPKRVLPTAAL